VFPPNVQTKPFCIILSICSESALVRTIQNLKVPRPDLHMVKERGFMQCHVGDQGLLSPMSSWGCKLWWAKRSHAVRQARFEKYGTINNQLRGLMRRSRFYRNLIQAESCIEHLCPCARVCVCVSVCHDCACVSFRREFLQRMRKQHDILTAVELLATQLRVSFLFHSATAQEFGPAEEATSTAVR